MDLLDHRARFALGEGGDEFAVRAAVGPVERDLDAVDAVLNLAPDLLDGLVAVGDELADGALGRADKAGIPIGEALPRRDVASGGGDARPVEEPGAQRVAQREADLAGITRRTDRGNARRQHLLREEEGAQRAELGRRVEVNVLLALGVAIGEMGVHVDETGHDEAPAYARRPSSQTTRLQSLRASSSRPVNSDPQRTCKVMAEPPLPGPMV
jgi:hypothetical protein